MTNVALTRAEQGLSLSIDDALVCINRFSKVVEDSLEYQTVTDYIADITDKIGDFKIDLERVIAERQKLEAEISQLRSDAAWAEEYRARAATWDAATWK